MVDYRSEPTYAEKNRVPPPPPWASWHNIDKVATACLYGRESRGAQGKNTTSCYLFLFYFIIHFLLLDNSIAYMFIHTVHAYAHILLHKMDGSRRHILKGTVEGNIPPPHKMDGSRRHILKGTVEGNIPPPPRQYHTV